MTILKSKKRISSDESTKVYFFHRSSLHQNTLSNLSTEKKRRQINKRPHST